MIPLTTAAQAAGVTPRRLRALCQQGRIRGAKKLGRDWLLPPRWSITPATRGPSLKRGSVGRDRLPDVAT